MLANLLILLLATSHIEGIYECCPEENILSLVKKSCSTNDSISLHCDGFRIPADESMLKKFQYFLMNNGTMIDQGNNEEIKYCQSYPDDDSNNFKHIYIVCTQPDEPGGFENNKIKVGAVLGYISAGFIILTIIVYAIVPSLLDLQGICMLHALIGQAMGYIFLGVIQLMSLGQTACTTLPFFTYFCFLYLFFWLDTLSFEIWRTTVKLECLSRAFKWKIIYHTFAIGGTILCLILLLLAHNEKSEMWDDIRPGIGEVTCWFKSMRETMIFFYGPITILLLFNAVFYLWTVIVFWGQAENKHNKILKYRLKLCVKLFIIMGITWFFEIISAILKDPQMSIFGKILFFLLDLFNILQGFLIFLILVVFRKRVRRALASKNLCNIQFPNSWKYLEDEEIESVEERINNAVVEFKETNVEVEVKR